MHPVSGCFGAIELAHRRRHTRTHQPRLPLTPVLTLKRLVHLATCEEASRLISQAQEGPLKFGDWVRLRFHVYWCVACKRLERQVGFLREAMRRRRQ